MWRSVRAIIYGIGDQVNRGPVFLIRLLTDGAARLRYIRMVHNPEAVSIHLAFAASGWRRKRTARMPATTFLTSNKSYRDTFLIGGGHMIRARRPGRHLCPPW